MANNKCLAYCLEFRNGGVPSDRITAIHILNLVGPSARTWAETEDEFAAIDDCESQARKILN